MESKPKDRRLSCFRGHTPDQCPTYKIETEKMFYAVLVVIATSLLVVCALVSH